jgi:hypothetical protein
MIDKLLEFTLRKLPSTAFPSLQEELRLLASWTSILDRQFAKSLNRETHKQAKHNTVHEKTQPGEGRLSLTVTKTDTKQCYQNRYHAA